MMAFLLCSLISFVANAGTIHILSAESLQKNYSHYRAVDAREGGREELPGAVRMNWKDWALENPSLWNYFFGDSSRWGKIAEDSVGERLTKLGISNATPIAVVGTPNAWGEEGRIAWNLLFWGAEDVSLVDGGYPAWAALPQQNVSPRPADRVPFSLKIEKWRRASMEDVMTNTHTLLDARSTEEFHGKTMSGQKRGGHIPGANSVPLEALYEKDGHYLSSERLRALLPREMKEPISYCTGGVRSGLLALLMESKLGLRVANYDGSIWEWASHKELSLIIE